MKAAILNPGPSLTMYAGGDYDLVVGVNRSATAHRCDVWCAMDWPLIRDVHNDVIGTPPLVISCPNTYESVVSKRWWRGDVVGLYEFLSVMPEKFVVPDAETYAWPKLSCTTAIAYAVSRGATSIDLYGADWCGQEDWDGGRRPGDDRLSNRWDKERRTVLEGIVPWLASQGIGFHRYMKPLYVSFYTAPYAEHAAGLVESLKAFGLEYDVRELPSGGSWIANVNRKSSFVLEMMQAHPGRSIVWLDADAVVRRAPSLFDSLNCDFAAHWRHDVELLSGTTYWGPTANALRLCEAWCQQCAENPEVWDQQNLQAAINLTPGLNVHRLPAPYTAVWDDAKMGTPETWVVSHHQASRTLRESA